VFDDRLTSRFVEVVAELLAGQISPLPRVLIALERRINFLIDQLAIRDVALDHLHRCIDERALAVGVRLHVDVARRALEEVS
jgi:hypothetical protein